MTGVVVCMKVSLDLSLSSASTISINRKVNSKAAIGMHDSADAVPDGLVAVQWEAGVLGVETVGCRCIDAHIAGWKIFLQQFEKIKNSKQLVL